MSLRVTDLECVFAPGTELAVQVLKGITFELGEGEWLGVCGHTGSGKSTLGAALAALVPISAGSVAVDEIEFTPDTRPEPPKMRALRSHVGIVFQYPEQQLFAESVEEEVAFGPRNFFPDLSPGDLAERVRWALGLVGFDDAFLKRSPFELSGGERRRVAIASTLATRPRYLVLDEPTSGLDAVRIRDLIELIGRLTREGVGVLHITHDMEIAFSHCTRLLVLEEGRQAAYGPPEQVVRGFCEHALPKGLILPPVLGLCVRLRARGQNVPLTWDENVLLEALGA